MLRDGWADLVLGTRCVGCTVPGRTLCRDCAHLLTAPAPLSLDLDGIPAVAAGEYAGLLRAAILAHKEDGVWALARPLGQLLAAVLPLAESRLVVVPAPSARAATRRRGYDPTRAIVRGAAARLRGAGRPVVCVPLLRQIRPVADQAGLSAGERHSNLEGALAVLPAARRTLAQEHRYGRGQMKLRVVVCDDVLTTGATAREACRALSAAGLPPAAVVVLAASQLRHSQQIEPKSLSHP